MPTWKEEETTGAHEKVTTLRHTRKRIQVLNLETTLYLKETTVAHEKIPYKKKVTNKQVDGIETNLNEQDYLDRDHQ